MNSYMKKKHIKLVNSIKKIYYELERYDKAMEVIDSYRHFPAKNKSVSDTFRKYSNEFVKYYAELLKVKEKKAKISITW